MSKKRRRHSPKQSILKRRDADTRLASGQRSSVRANDRNQDGTQTP
ncbi:hypothetical protein [Rubripirellula lacrimiformis]|nr:hypothetical protein [Rubripirellula lacrimiformis]